MFKVTHFYGQISSVFLWAGGGGLGRWVGVGSGFLSLGTADVGARKFAVVRDYLMSCGVFSLTRSSTH